MCVVILLVRYPHVYPDKEGTLTKKQIKIEYVVNDRFCETVHMDETEPVIKPAVMDDNITAATEDVVPKFTEDDLFCIAAVIYNEAGGDACGDEQRMAVGNVVLNRTNDDRFPNTIREVLEEKKQYAGMSKGVKFANRSKNADEKHAVERAYQMAERVLNGETVCPENVVWQAEFIQGVGIWKKIGNTYFCY